MINLILSDSPAVRTAATASGVPSSPIPPDGAPDQSFIILEFFLEGPRGLRILRPCFFDENVNAIYAGVRCGGGDERNWRPTGVDGGVREVGKLAMDNPERRYLYVRCYVAAYFMGVRAGDSGEDNRHDERSGCGILRGDDSGRDPGGHGPTYGDMVDGFMRFCGEFVGRLVKLCNASGESGDGSGDGDGGKKGEPAAQLVGAGVDVDVEVE